MHKPTTAAGQEGAATDKVSLTNDHGQRTKDKGRQTTDD
jgi:hypothetical protein